jgi:hypothetical protein
MKYYGAVRPLRRDPRTEWPAVSSRYGVGIVFLTAVTNVQSKNVY